MVFASVVSESRLLCCAGTTDSTSHDPQAGLYIAIACLPLFFFLNFDYFYSTLNNIPFIPSPLKSLILKLYSLTIDLFATPDQSVKSDLIENA